MHMHINSQECIACACTMCYHALLFVKRKTTVRGGGKRPTNTRKLQLYTAKEGGQKINKKSRKKHNHRKRIGGGGGGGGGSKSASQAAIEEPLHGVVYTRSHVNTIK